MPVAPSAATQLKSFIDKFAAEHQALIRGMRKVLRARLTSAHEIVYDSYQFFVIGYSTTERPSDSMVTIGASAKGVVLGFYYGAALPDPHRLLLGSGNRFRFIRIDSLTVLNDPTVIALLDAAVDQAEPPLSKAGKGRLIIRMIAEKQRSRKKAVR